MNPIKLGLPKGSLNSKDRGNTHQVFVDAGYDWVILDGRLFKGEREFAHFFEKWAEKTSDTIFGRGCNCENEVLEEKMIPLRRTMHRTISQSTSPPGFSKNRSFGEEGGQVFGYHAPCRAKR